MGVFFVALVLVLMRWKPQEWDKRGPLVSSWAYRLLATTVGVIYVFTSIAKMDQEWCGGHTLRSVGATEDVLSPVARMATATGLQTDTFWSLLATMVIPLELTLAVCYLLAVGQDEPNRKWLRRFCFLGWGLAVGLHLNNEMMNLIIQWFGYYMLLLATIVLLPARILMLLGQFFVWPDCWCRDYLTKRLDDSGSWNSVFGLGVCSTFALISLVTLGFYAHIVGAIVASCLLAFGLVAVLLLGMIPGWRRASMRVAMVTTISSLLMIVAIWQCSMRFDYYAVRGKTLQLLGNDRDAIIEFEHGARLPARTKLVAAELLTNLGVSYRRTGDEAKAEEIYRLAIKKYPAQFLAHYSLGNLLVQQQRLDEAMEYYRNAIAIKSDLSDAYVNLGNVLEFKNRYAEAVECYEAALRAEPKAVDIQQLLQAAREKLK